MNNNLKDPLIHYFLDKPEVIAIYLFGSRATGKADHSSDVDIGILLDTKDQAKQTRRRKQYMLDLANILKKEIHPVILNYAGEELMRQVFTHGKCILVKDQKKLSLFRMTTFARIADFGYYRTRMQSGLIRSIVED